tara:strand:- start:80 stop:499 length:420 start_codon:yes stop_codon:yes gene_type:complete
MGYIRSQRRTEEIEVVESVDPNGLVIDVNGCMVDFEQTIHPCFNVPVEALPENIKDYSLDNRTPTDEDIEALCMSTPQMEEICQQCIDLGGIFEEDYRACPKYTKEEKNRRSSKVGTTGNAGIPSQLRKAQTISGIGRR